MAVKNKSVEPEETVAEDSHATVEIGRAHV